MSDSRSGDSRLGPIKPEDVPTAHVPQIPEAIFGAFNDLIAQHITAHGTARVLLKDVRRLAAERGVDLGEADQKHWWDVEAAYRGAGWKVSYDQPAYNESHFAPYFEFRKGDGR